ncbi:MAG: hypothetical protein QMC40_02205 [Vicingaceae bacterium]|jgi:hypothetical protein|tara:strand:+ start:145 stop:612 length:468 start_codon:yes stop_codon:yes gene_type:complete
MKLFVKIGIGISILSSLCACREDSDFSEIPELFYRDFQISTNEAGRPIAIWKLGFTDGDGNIGVRDGNEKDSNNFIVSGFQYIDGKITTLPPLQGYRIPAAENVSTRNGIEGEFRFEFEIDSYISFNIDSMYLEGYVIDRSFNESNSIETPIFLD